MTMSVQFGVRQISTRSVWFRVPLHLGLWRSSKSSKGHLSGLSLSPSLLSTSEATSEAGTHGFQQRKRSWWE